MSTLDGPAASNHRWLNNIPLLFSTSNVQASLDLVDDSTQILIKGVRIPAQVMIAEFASGHCVSFTLLTYRTTE